MDHSVQCAHCKAILKTPAPVAAGKKVKCPKCQQVFAVAAVAEASSKTMPPAAPAAPPKPRATKLATARAQATKLAPAVEPSDSATQDHAEPGKVPEAEADEVPVGAIQDKEKSRPSKRNETNARQKNLREDDDEDDAPRRRNKSQRDDENDEVPRGRKKDQRDDDEDGAPRKRSRDNGDPQSGKPKQKSRGMLLFILLGGGGLLGLFGCCGCGGVGGYFLFFHGPPIVGRWESDNIDGRGRVEFEFMRNGTGTAKVKNLGRTVTEHFNYQYTSGDPAFVDITVTRVDGGLNLNIGQPVRYQVTFIQGTVHLTGVGFPGGFTLRRAP